ncbi:MAG: hypothetical protein PVJ61_05450 [Dehalococcoidia bacterium]|jgi:hypothetical protein
MSEVSIIGIFLTLVGLLGSFFYIHLSSWFRDLIALKNKWELNAIGSTPQQKQAQLECLYAIRGLYNYVPGLVAGVITLFIGLVSGFILNYLFSIEVSGALSSVLWVVFLAFLATYFTLTLYFLIAGYRTGAKLNAEINKKFPKPRKAKPLTRSSSPPAN